MTPLRFPRYLSRDPRDFFFLTLRAVLPGPALTLNDASIAFSAAGLPHAGYPAALARAEVENARGRATLVRIDPARAEVATEPSEAAPVLRLPPAIALPGIENAPDAAQQLALFTRRIAGLQRLQVGVPTQGARVLGEGPAFDSRKSTRALGVDREGFLLYVELTEGAPALLDELLEAAGVTRALALSPLSRAAVMTETGQRMLDGQETPAGASPHGLAFALRARPAAEVMFSEVEPKPYRFWGYQQGQRVRYFPQHPPRFRAPEDTLPAAADSPAR
jgi:hypothetical protein